MHNRFDRQERLFGHEGQERICKSRVCIVGLGGLGSLVTQLLARLGVGAISLVDDDIIERSNLNRLIGATSQDVFSKNYKVDVMKRLIESIDSSIHTETIRKNLRTIEAFQAIKKSSYVFGCVDNDGPRLIINELCAAYEIPYFDLASEILQGTHLNYGGRIFTCSDNEGCLACCGEISTEEVQKYLESKEIKETKAAIYGVDTNNLGDSGPSVVTLNAVIAGLAVMEFMVMVTGLRKPSRLLTYRGDWGGIVCQNNDVPTTSDCYYCKAIRGKGSKAKVERYIIK